LEQLARAARQSAKSNRAPLRPMVAWLGVTGVVRTGRMVLVMGVLRDLSEFCSRSALNLTQSLGNDCALSAWYLIIQW
jgi:hypothetical protein